MRSVFSRNSAAVALGLAYAGFAYLLAPAAVNGDGVGYLKATYAGDTYPGHLLLLPLFAMVKQLVHPRAVIELLGPLRLVQHIGAGVALAIVFVTLSRRGRRAAYVGTLGLGASFAVVAAASDIESYAPTLVPIALLLFALDRERPWLAAVAAALATLLHVQNAVLGVAVVLVAPSWRTRVAVGALFGTIVGAAYFFAVQHFGWTWLREMHHGLLYPLGWRIGPALLHGVGKALIYAPYPYEAALSRVVLHGTLGIGALLLLVGRTASVTETERRWLLGWIVPVVLLGARYFPSDQERWIFALPVLWWYVAAAPRRWDPLLVAAIATINLVVWLPVAKDGSARARAARVAPLLRDGDLVISPGHGWDELVGLYEPRAIVRLPLVVFGGLEDLDAKIARARRAAPRTILLRMDGSDRDPRGWKDLQPQGYDQARVRALLPGWRFSIGEGVELLVRPE